MMNLSPLVLLVAIVFVALIVAPLLAKRRKGDIAGEFVAYKKATALFTPAEVSFMNVLELAVSDRFRVYGKVRLADLVGVRSGLDNSTRQKAFNRVQSKHVDFVLCAKESREIACAVELDDRTHSRKKTQARDIFLNGLCNAVGLPLARIPAKSGYTVDEVRDKVYGAIRSAV